MLNILTTGIAVESKVVLGARTKTSDLVLERKGCEAVGESCGGFLTLEAKDVGSQASNVRSGHRGTRNGVLVEKSAF
jgi:hypothetical protein